MTLRILALDSTNSWTHPVVHERYKTYYYKGDIGVIVVFGSGYCEEHFLQGAEFVRMGFKVKYVLLEKM